MVLVSRQVTAKHHQGKQRDAHSVPSRSAPSKLAENQSDSGSMRTALQPVLCWCCSPAAQPWLPAAGTESRDSRAWGQPCHPGLCLLCWAASPSLRAVPVVAAQAEPPEELKVAAACFWDGSQSSTLTAQHCPLCTARVPGWHLGTQNSSGIILLLPSVGHPSSCPQAHRDGHEARTGAKSELVTRSLTKVMAVPFVFRGSAPYIPGIVTIVLVMNNLNFVPYCFPKPQLQNFLLGPSPVRRHESMDGCI